MCHEKQKRDMNKAVKIARHVTKEVYQNGQVCHNDKLYCYLIRGGAGAPELRSGGHVSDDEDVEHGQAGEGQVAVQHAVYPHPHTEGVELVCRAYRACINLRIPEI